MFRYCCIMIKMHSAAFRHMLLKVQSPVEMNDLFNLSLMVNKRLRVHGLRMETSWCRKQYIYYVVCLSQTTKTALRMTIDNHQERECGCLLPPKNTRRSRKVDALQARSQVSSSNRSLNSSNSMAGSTPGAALSLAPNTPRPFKHNSTPPCPFCRIPLSTFLELPTLPS
jgi:hypothetical protein